MSQEPPNLEAFGTRLLEKASIDDVFRQQLLAKPKATIEQELKVTIAPGLEIQVVEETPTKICLVLPMRSQPGGAQQLPDQQLEKVAGGTLPIPLPRTASGLERLGRFGLSAGVFKATPIQLP